MCVIQRTQNRAWRVFISMARKAFRPIHLSPSSHLNAVVWKGYGCHDNNPGGRWPGWSASSKRCLCLPACVCSRSPPPSRNRRGVLTHFFMNLRVNGVFQLLPFNCFRRSPKHTCSFIFMHHFGFVWIAKGRKGIICLYCHSLFSLKGYLMEIWQPYQHLSCTVCC